MADTKDLKSFAEKHVGSTPTSRTILGHEFKPCYYKDPIKYYPGMCLNPAGPDRCHIGNCWKLESEH